MDRFFENMKKLFKRAGLVLRTIWKRFRTKILCAFAFMVVMLIVLSPFVLEAFREEKPNPNQVLWGTPRFGEEPPVTFFQRASSIFSERFKTLFASKNSLSGLRAKKKSSSDEDEDDYLTRLRNKRRAFSRERKTKRDFENKKIDDEWDDDFASDYRSLRFGKKKNIKDNTHNSSDRYREETDENTSYKSRPDRDLYPFDNYYYDNKHDMAEIYAFLNRRKNESSESDEKQYPFPPQTQPAGGRKSDIKNVQAAALSAGATQYQNAAAGQPQGRVQGTQGTKTAAFPFVHRQTNNQNSAGETNEHRTSDNLFNTPSTGVSSTASGGSGGAGASFGSSGTSGSGTSGTGGNGTGYTQPSTQDIQEKDKDKNKFFQSDGFDRDYLFNSDNHEAAVDNLEGAIDSLAATSANGNNALFQQKLGPDNIFVQTAKGEIIDKINEEYLNNPTDKKEENNSPRYRNVSDMLFSDPMVLDFDKLNIPTEYRPISNKFIRPMPWASPAEIAQQTQIDPDLPQKISDLRDGDENRKPALVILDTRNSIYVPASKDTNPKFADMTETYSLNSNNPNYNNRAEDTRKLLQAAHSTLDTPWITLNKETSQNELALQAITVPLRQEGYKLLGDPDNFNTPYSASGDYFTNVYSVESQRIAAIEGTKRVFRNKIAKVLQNQDKISTNQLSPSEVEEVREEARQQALHAVKNFEDQYIQRAAKNLEAATLASMNGSPANAYRIAQEVKNQGGIIICANEETFNDAAAAIEKGRPENGEMLNLATILYMPSKPLNEFASYQEFREDLNHQINHAIVGAEQTLNEQHLGEQNEKNN